MMAAGIFMAPLVWLGVSRDFVHWESHRMERYDIGYAPIVVKHGGKFLLTACDAGIWESSSPSGPWRELGPLLNVDGRMLPDWLDPMIFSDDDGRLYAYWELAGPGISLDIQI